MPEQFPEEERREPIVSVVIQDGMRQLQDVLLQSVLEEVKEDLDALMREFEHEEAHQGLDHLGSDDPVLPLIAQWLCYRICRSNLFSADPNCKKEIKNNSSVVTDMRKKHDLTGTCCKDRMRYILEAMYPERIQIKLTTGDGEEAGRQWDFDKRPCLGCAHFHDRHHSIEAHAKKHGEMDANIEALGRFWASIGTMIKANAAITIGEAIGEGPAFQCRAENCGKIFATKTNLTRHCSQDHPGEKRNG
jgi:hypothetical protein